MKSKEKQRHKLMVHKKTSVVSSSDEDSHTENPALLARREEASLQTGELHHRGKEYEGSDEEEEGEEASDDDGSTDVEEEGKGSESSGENETEEDDDDDVGGSSGTQTKEEIRTELSHMSFEDIIMLQNKVGTKVYNEVAYGSRKSGNVRKKKRLNKNRPVEISAKKPAPFIRQVVPSRKPTRRDPRFDDLSGEYKPEIFEKTYKFINDIKLREKEIIQKKLKKTKRDGEKRKELQFLLKRLENQERARLNQEQQRERELQFKRQQREQTHHGDHPFFLKKSDKKKLQLAEKYLDLKKSGKLENFLSKKRKRNAAKDRRKLPSHKTS
uniref:rRNA biogenesis protein RRP36 n=1 Tax=Nothobranchius korthausae TaxID=1143690 RepID=A0A1A8ES15_9TELE